MPEGQRVVRCGSCESCKGETMLILRGVPETDSYNTVPALLQSTHTHTLRVYKLACICKNNMKTVISYSIVSCRCEKSH